MSETNIQHICNDLSTTHWEDVLNNNEVNSMYNKFVQIILIAFDKACPIRFITGKQHRPHKQWMTTGLVNA